MDATLSVLIAQGQIVDLPGLTYTFSVTGNAKVMVNFTIPAWTASCAFCGMSQVTIYVNLDGTNKSVNQNHLPNDDQNTNSGSTLLQVGAGTHTIKLSCSIWGPSVHVSADASYIYHNEMILQIIPE